MAFKDTLNQLLNGQNLSHTEMLATMHQVMCGELTPVQISAFLIALRLKGETVDEIAAAATVMRELSTKVKIKNTTNLVDTCGTGNCFSICDCGSWRQSRQAWRTLGIIDLR
jgi:anthranilate phosphoribosyltransferase